MSVRLNTNESPYPPPAGVRRPRGSPSCARAAEPLPRPRRTRPARRARAPARATGRAAVLRQRLQRGAPDAAAHATAVPAGARSCSSRRTRCTRTSPASPGPRWSWASARDDFSVDPDAARALVAEQRPDDRVRVQPQQPDGHRRAAGDRRGAARRRTDGLVVVDEAYGEFAPRQRARPRATTTRRLVVVRTYSKVWSLAALRLGFASRRRGSSRSSRRSCCRTTSAARHADRRQGRARVRRPRWTSASSAWSRSGSACSPRSTAIDGVTRVPVGRQLRAVPGARRRPRALAGARRPRRARARLLGLARLARLPAGHGRHARGERRVPRRAPRVAPGGSGLMSRDRREQHRVTKETTVDLVARRRRQRRRDARRPASRSSTTCSSSSASTAASTSRIEAHRRPRGRHAPHGRGRRHRARHRVQGGARRQGGRAPVRRRARAARRGAGAGRARPVGPPVPRLRGRPGRRSGSARSTRSSPRSSGARSRSRPGITLHMRSLSGRNGHHVIEASFKGVARCLRDAVKIERHAASRRPRAAFERRLRAVSRRSTCAAASACACYRGDFAAETVYDDDPVAVARATSTPPGAAWIHVVDLDAARTGERRQPRRDRGDLRGGVVPGADRRRRPQRRGGRRRCLRRRRRARGRRAPPRSSTRSSSTSSVRAHPGTVAVGLDARGRRGRRARLDRGQRPRSRRSRRAGSTTPASARSWSPRSAATARSRAPTSTSSAPCSRPPTVPVIASGGVGTLDDLRALAGSSVGRPPARRRDRRPGDLRGPVHRRRGAGAAAARRDAQARVRSGRTEPDVPAGRRTAEGVRMGDGQTR